MQRSASLVPLILLGVAACAAPDPDAVVEQPVFGNPLGSVLGSPVASNNTSGLANQHTPTCGPPSAAPDIAYTWTAPATGAYTFTTAGSETSFAPFDTLVEVRSLPGNAALGCDDNSGGSAQSSVTVALTAGQAVVVVIDGVGSAQGTFRLGITGPAGSTGGRTYRCGYALAGFQCDGGRASTLVTVPDLTAAVSACELAHPLNLPDSCYIADLTGAGTTDPGQCIAAGGAWRPNSKCCNFVGTLSCPN
jgi:hypothetical protein